MGEGRLSADPGGVGFGLVPEGGGTGLQLPRRSRGSHLKTIDGVLCPCARKLQIYSVYQVLNNAKKCCKLRYATPFCEGFAKPLVWGLSNYRLLPRGVRLWPCCQPRWEATFIDAGLVRCDSMEGMPWGVHRIFCNSRGLKWAVLGALPQNML